MVMPFGMSMYGSGINVYQNMKQKYGCGHADFGTAPKFAEVPIEIAPARPAKQLPPGFWAKYFYLRHM